MDSAAFQLWLDRLRDRAKADPDIVGLVALGSTAALSRSPDPWSDHDVWVVTRDGAAAALRDDPSWLPDAGRIVGFFTETRHGRSIVYEDGHLVELAVFDDAELEVARANDYRVLFDGGGIVERLFAISDRTAQEHHSTNRATHFAGSFVTQMLIGLGRYGRGELVSANQLLRELAPTSLLQVVAAMLPAVDGDAVDNLDPRRRVERAHPDVAARLTAALDGQLLDVAVTLLDLARAMGESFPANARPALDAVEVALARSSSARPRTPTLHHIQLAVPPGFEDSARRFYGGVLGLDEVEKPAALAGRGGCWFRGPTIELHIGVEEPFRAAAESHPAIRVEAIDDLADRLVASGYGVKWDDSLPGYRRFYTNDAVGNRLEFLEPD